ncbi:4478_t:CDS:2, partial [Gigaspora margarita]
LLFTDEMIALENGAVVYEIYRYLAENDNEWLLDALQTVPNVKEAKDKQFIATCFEYFKINHDKCLESLSGEKMHYFLIAKVKNGLLTLAGMTSQEKKIIGDGDNLAQHIVSYEE